MLTEQERKIVVDALRTYPAGVPVEAWGWGPMAVTADNTNYPRSDMDFNPSILKPTGDSP